MTFRKGGICLRALCPLLFLCLKTEKYGGYTMKKTISFIFAALLICGMLSACGRSDRPAAEPGRLKIVTTIFPEYDWVMNILGDKGSDADVSMLLDTGVDLHSFQPTAADILRISECDLFIYVGGESEEWAEDAVKEAVNKDMTVINLLDVLGDAVKEEETVEGMEEEHEEEHEHEEDETEYDEHVWLSLRNAAILTESISEAIQKIDPANAASYKKNTEEYLAKLNVLDEKYKAAVSESRFNTLLFGDRFPFRYLVDDYGLSYYAAFPGCSAETEASFKTIIFLAEKADELSLPAVMTIERADRRIAETIIQNTASKDLKILTMDSMQATTAEDVKNGTTYLSVMENNLSVLKEALGYPGEDTAAKEVPEQDPDVDLTDLSANIVYAQVYDMMVSPEKYTGKTVKMQGPFAYYHDDATDKDYFACIIRDATACCSQGIEFVLAGEHSYPDDYPAIDEEICVLGVFDTYSEGKYTYCTLRNAKLI